MSTFNKVPILALLAFVALIAIQPSAISQTPATPQLSFAQAFIDVRTAEAAGASSSDISGLVALLNKALELNHEALQTNTTAEERTLLLTQVDQILLTVHQKAVELAASSGQEVLTDTILRYVGGAMLAVLATVVYSLSLLFYRRYRVRRTFQMRARVD